MVNSMAETKKYRLIKKDQVDLSVEIKDSIECSNLHGSSVTYNIEYIYGVGWHFIPGQNKSVIIVSNKFFLPLSLWFIGNDG